jgi:imidazole glycerol phosphate synthase subunit HisF
VEHFVEVFTAGAAGASASAAFLSGRISIAAVKQACAAAGIEVSGAPA